MEFSEKLKIVSQESGVNLKEISELTHIPYDTLKKYSNGSRIPKFDKIQQIASIPQLEPWKELLLEQTELTADESEFMILFARLKAQGLEAEALAILRDLEDQQGGE